MHAGNIQTSKRLKQTLACLAGGRWKSTMEIALATESCAVHSDIAALRAQGVNVECRTMPGKGNERRRQYRIADSAADDLSAGGPIKVRAHTCQVAAESHSSPQPARQEELVFA